MKNVRHKSFLGNLAPVQVLALGFAVLIIVGAVLLTLPVSSASGKSTPFLSSLFTSTSAVCVTGLVVVDTATHWSTFGQVVILILIQAGGLGFMSFATLLALLLGKKITLKERLVMQEALNSFSIQGLVNLAKYALVATFSIEAIGAVLLSIKFIPVYGASKGIYYGIFHAISAYCNAGFDLMGNYQSLVPFQESIIVNVTVMLLIIIGGIGFVVQSDIFKHRSFKKLSLHSKVVLTTTGILILSGAILFFIFENSNPNTIGPLSAKGKVLSSFFASVTPRTAGFNTIDTTQMSLASKFVTIILMFVGASPGSTGGGIKTSTFAILVLTVIAIIRGREDTEVHGRRIPRDIIYRAFSIAAIGLTLILVDVLILSITESGASLTDIMYETTSAFGTVGLSLGFTPKLTDIGRIVILLTMYIGRVGPLTLAFALAQKRLRNNSQIKYPEEKILIG